MYVSSSTKAFHCRPGQRPGHSFLDLCFPTFAFTAICSNAMVSDLIQVTGQLDLDLLTPLR